MTVSCACLNGFLTIPLTPPTSCPLILKELGGSMIIIQALFSLLALTVHAVEGQFDFKGQYEVTGSTRYESVYASSTAGKARVVELQNDGYSCQPKMQFIQCKKVFPGQPSLPVAIATHSSPVQSVNFGAVQAMNLISQGDNVAIFEAAQTTVVNGISFPVVTYIERIDMIKASVGNPNTPDAYFSFLIYPESIAVLDTISVTESKWAFHAYDVTFFLQK